MIKNQIKKQLKLCLDKIKIKEKNIELEHPSNFDFGDYSSNIALKQAKRLKTNPMALAKKIVENFPKTNLIEKIEIVKPGFINFWISKKILINQLEIINSKKELYGKLNLYENLKVMIEYTDPNPFKEFHIGHLFTNTIGESIARLFQETGAIVKRANYQGDVGMHVSKSIWGMLKKIKNKKFQPKAGQSLTEKIKSLEKLNLKERIKFLGQAYALGATAYKKNPQAQKQIKNINYLIYISAQNYLKEKENWKPIINYHQYVKVKKTELKEIETLFKKGREWSLEYFEIIYKRLGTKFDFYYFESQIGEYGVQLVKKFLDKNIFIKSKGAVVFPGEKYNLHTRVFLNSYGLPTYEAKDLGLAPTKYKDFPYDKSIVITGNEIDKYFQVILQAMKFTNPSLAPKTFHISHGMLRLPEGKMSSRTGKIVSGQQLIDETKKRLYQIIQKSKKISKKEIEDTCEKIAIGAVKYSLLKTNIGKDVIFNFGESLSFEGNSGPYLQYTYARCKSILRKSQKSINLNLIHENELSNKFKKQLKTLYLKNEEIYLLRSLYKFPEVVLEATENYAPNILCNYLFNLARRYNLFYQNQPILKTEKSLKKFRLLLTNSIAQVIKNGLYLLGIETVEKM